MTNDLMKKMKEERTLNSQETRELDILLSRTEGVRSLVRGLEGDQVSMAWRAELNAKLEALRPSRRFGFDAAILFSDILVICEAMGQPYHFRESGGVELAFPVRTPADIDRLVAIYQSSMDDVVSAADGPAVRTPSGQ